MELTLFAIYSQLSDCFPSNFKIYKRASSAISEQHEMNLTVGETGASWQWGVMAISK